MSAVLGPGEGKQMSVMGNDLCVKAGANDTGGAFSVMEYSAGAGFGGPPPHVHQRMVEAFYVLEGELNVTVGKETARAGPGGFVLVSAGTVHTFSNQGTVPAKFILLVSPGGFEKYFEELPAIVDTHGYPPPPEIMSDLGRRYDIAPPPAD